jgi:hypothetical protein
MLTNWISNPDAQRQGLEIVSLQTPRSPRVGKMQKFVLSNKSAMPQNKAEVRNTDIYQLLNGCIFLGFLHK